MKKTKTQKGITLVALIITIVVLLILAVVAIGAVRDSNIIAHAQNAASMYNQAKNNELAALAGYEDLMKGPIEYKVYGTEDFYVIISSEDDIIVVQDSKTQIDGKMTKKGKEEYLSELSGEEVTSMREDIEAIENEYGASFEYLAFVEGVNDGYPIGGAIGNKMFAGEGLLEVNETLAKKVVRKKGTYQCFGHIDENGNGIVWDVNYNDNTCTWYVNGSAPKKYAKNIINQNEETITIYIENDEPVTIGSEAKKIEFQFEGEAETHIFYIKDSKLYMKGSMNGITDGDTGCIGMPLIDYDLSKIGIIVVE